MKLSDALRKAQGIGLDLVEIAPTANPPVCKIVALGKFRYDISKHTKDKKPASSKLKEIKFRVNIDEHDYVTKIRHGEEFLDRGNKVRVQLQFRGREMAHQEFGMQLVKIRHGEEFLDRGNKVRVQLQFRGREMAHQEFGMQLVEKVRDDLSSMSQVEMEPKITGRNITMTLAPLPASRRKRKFTVPPEAPDQSEKSSSPIPA